MENIETAIDDLRKQIERLTDVIEQGFEALNQNLSNIECDIRKN